MPVCQLLLFEIPQRMPIEFYGERVRQSERETEKQRIYSSNPQEIGVLIFPINVIERLWYRVIKIVAISVYIHLVRETGDRRLTTIGLSVGWKNQLICNLLKHNNILHIPAEKREHTKKLSSESFTH